MLLRLVLGHRLLLGGRLGGVAQGNDLALFQLAPFAGLHHAKLQRPYRDALQPHHFQTHRFTHTANLAVFALGNAHLEHHTSGLLFHHMDDGRLGHLYVAVFANIHPGAKLNSLLICNIRAYSDSVGFGNMVAGVHNQVCKLAIVGKQQQAFAVSVQTPDGVHTGTHVLHLPAANVRAT